MCGEGLFSVGLGSCGRGIEKTATSGLVSVCACAVRDGQEHYFRFLLCGLDVQFYANLVSGSLIGPFGSPGPNAAL